MACFAGSTISIRRGDHAAGRFTVTDLDTGLAIDLTSWQKFYFTIKRSLDDADATAVFALTSPATGLTVTTPAAGIVDYEIPPSATSALPARRQLFFYDFQGKDPTGKIKTFSAGALEVCPDVTISTA